MQFVNVININNVPSVILIYPIIYVNDCKINLGEWAILL